MDIPVLLARIAGVVLLAWTVWSIVKNYKHKRAMRKEQDSQSASEKFLNSALLYLWLAFMIAFSVGMIINN